MGLFEERYWNSWIRLRLLRCLCMKAENAKLTRALKTQGAKRERVKKANPSNVLVSRLDVYRNQEGECEGRVNLEAEPQAAANGRSGEGL